MTKLVNVVEFLFSNTLINIYWVYAIVSIALTIYFVLLPINQLRIDWMLTRKDGKFSELREFFKSLKSYKTNSKKIRNYLLFESSLAVFPLLTVLVFRLLQQPNNYAISDIQCAIFAVVLFGFCLFNLKECIEFKQMLNPWLTENQRWYQQTKNPKFIYGVLGVTKVTRSKLRQLSELKTPEYVEVDEIDLKDMYLLDVTEKVSSEAIIENLGQIGKNFKQRITNTITAGKNLSKDIAALGATKLSEQLDKNVNDNVDYYTTISDERWRTAFLYTLRVITPILVMYIL